MKSSYEKPIFCFLILLYLHVASVVSQGCDKVECKGPTDYYKVLNCTPIYEKEGDCCAVGYDCSHRSINKCYFNGKEYNVGERVAKEDLTLNCDMNCDCILGPNKIPTFSCVYPSCNTKSQKLTSGCYKKKNFDCCEEVVCPKNDDDVFKCEVNGKIYREGQRFYPQKHLTCVCSKGYEGKNVQPFCRQIKSQIELNYQKEINSNCVPVYYNCEKIGPDCSLYLRCQNNNDTVIPALNEPSSIGSSKVPSNMTCKFGNLQMRIGEMLSRNTDPRSKCVDCTCQVPPIPTCQRSLDETC